MKNKKQNINDIQCQYVRIFRQDLILAVAEKYSIAPYYASDNQLSTIRSLTDINILLADYFPKFTILRLTKYAIDNNLISVDMYKHTDDLEAPYKIEWFNVTAISKYVPIIPYTERHPKIASQLVSQSLYDSIRTSAAQLELPSKNVMITELMTSEKRGVTNNVDRNFTIITNGQMTYLPANKTCTVNSNNKWDRNNRQPIKYGRALRKIFKNKNIKDAEIEALNNILKSAHTFNGKFIEVKGYHIWKHYQQESYAPSQGSLNQSCMKYDECEDYLNLYFNNPDKIQLVAAINQDDETIGRALIWTCDDGLQYMDRIYGNDITIEAFKEYAINQGYLHKKVQSYNDNTFVKPNGSYADTSPAVTLYNSTLDFCGDEGRFPYMDTFKYTDATGQDTITLDTEECEITLDSTEGGPMFDYYETSRGNVEDFNSRYCKHTGKWEHVNDCIYKDDIYIYFHHLVEINGVNYDMHDPLVKEISDGVYELTVL